jgi:sugar/nucleoside kinase (ribokinase family)
MGILAVGSVALDTVKTPFGYEEDILGGSATYFSIAASFFSSVSVVAVVGDDFPEAHLELLRHREIDTSGVQRERGRTFRWRGEYSNDLNSARTLDTQLNVFANFKPRLLPAHRSPDVLFLGNIEPTLQREVLEQVQRPRLVGCDTMNYWISNTRESLLQTLERVDVLLINDAETRQLAGESNLFKAAHKILGLGPKTLVVKRGEYGALMLTAESVFGLPAYPVEEVCDPTGAGDSFAGGFMGFLASADRVDQSALRKAVVYGSVMASFNVCAFGPRRLVSLNRSDIDRRFAEFEKLTAFGRA